MSVARVPLTRFFPTPRDSFSNLQQYRREAPYVLPQVIFSSVHSTRRLDSTRPLTSPPPPPLKFPGAPNRAAHWIPSDRGARRGRRSRRHQKVLSDYLWSPARAAAAGRARASSSAGRQCRRRQRSLCASDAPRCRLVGRPGAGRSQCDCGHFRLYQAVRWPLVHSKRVSLFRNTPRVSYVIFYFSSQPSVFDHFSPIRHRVSKDSILIGFMDGPQGVYKGHYCEIDDNFMNGYRNSGGFDSTHEEHRHMHVDMLSLFCHSKRFSPDISMLTPCGV
jgi:hypothetical protein